MPLKLQPKINFGIVLITLPKKNETTSNRTKGIKNILKQDKTETQQNKTKKNKNTFKKKKKLKQFSSLRGFLPLLQELCAEALQLAQQTEENTSAKATALEAHGKKSGRLKRAAEILTLFFIFFSLFCFCLVCFVCLFVLFACCF